MSMRQYKNTDTPAAWVEESVNSFISEASDVLVKAANMSYTKPKLRESIKNLIMAG